MRFAPAAAFLLAVCLVCLVAGCGSDPYERGESRQARAELRAQGRPFTAEDFLRACNQGDYDTCNRYLDAGADPDTEDRHGETPLVVATARGDDDIVRLLLSYGAEVNVTDRQGRSAVRVALDEGHAEVARLLTVARHDAVTGD
jgi:ankyrin repeat protein